VRVGLASFVELLCETLGTTANTASTAITPTLSSTTADRLGLETPLTAHIVPGRAV
jgi:hypothetical protein